MSHYKEQLFKVLSRNDTGETGGHQSGISIPKFVAQSSVFPKMNRDILNHRCDITFTDEYGNNWDMQYIYYNDKYHGKPKEKCHDEFRLTCTNKFIRENSIKSGDQIWFAIDDSGKRFIGFLRAGQLVASEPKETPKCVVIKIKSWTTIKR